MYGKTAFNIVGIIAEKIH